MQSYSNLSAKIIRWILKTELPRLRARWESITKSVLMCCSKILTTLKSRSQWRSFWTWTVNRNSKNSLQVSLHNNKWSYSKFNNNRCRTSYNFWTIAEIILLIWTQFTTSMESLNQQLKLTWLNKKKTKIKKNYLPF